MSLKEYSTCEELFYLEDEKGNTTAPWLFKEENRIRAYHNGYHLHNDIKAFDLEPLPRFTEV